MPIGPPIAGFDVCEHLHEANPRLRNWLNVVRQSHMGSTSTVGPIETGGKVFPDIQASAEGHSDQT